MIGSAFSIFRRSRSPFSTILSIREGDTPITFASSLLLLSFPSRPKKEINICRVRGFSVPIACSSTVRNSFLSIMATGSVDIAYWLASSACTSPKCISAWVRFSFRANSCWNSLNKSSGRHQKNSASFSTSRIHSPSCFFGRTHILMSPPNSVGLILVARERSAAFLIPLSAILAKMRLFLKFISTRISGGVCWSFMIVASRRWLMERAKALCGYIRIKQHKVNLSH